MNTINESMDGFCRPIFLINNMLLLAAIWETDDSLPMSNSYGGDGIDADKRPGIVLVVVIGTLH
jgi:hypothetical protein